MHWNTKRPEDRVDSQLMVGLRRRDRERLEAASSRTGLPMSEIVRQALNAHFEGLNVPETREG